MMCWLETTHVVNWTQNNHIYFKYTLYIYTDISIHTENIKKKPNEISINSPKPLPRIIFAALMSLHVEFGKLFSGEREPPQNNIAPPLALEVIGPCSWLLQSPVLQYHWSLFWRLTFEAGILLKPFYVNFHILSTRNCIMN